MPPLRPFHPRLARVPGAPGDATAPAPAPPRHFGLTTLRDLQCPYGHHMREDAFVLDHAALRCKHRDHLGGRGERASGPECGALVYVVAVAAWTATTLPEPAPFVALAEADALLVVAEVTYAEVRTIQTQRLNAAGVIAYLGIRFPLAAGARRVASGP